MPLRLAILATCLHAVIGDWANVFHEPFNGSAVDPTRWNVWHNKTHGDKEWQLYTGDSVRVADGALSIVTAAAPPGTLGPDGKRAYAFTSGWLDTSGKVEMTFGRFEARIRLPVPVRSIWPAYWIVDDTRHCWPTGGEIDILEAVGGFRNESVFGTYHWGSACGEDDWTSDGQRNGAAAPPAGHNFSDAFHIFGVYFNRTAITWHVDGSPYVSRLAGEPSNLFVPSWPLFTILNTAMAYWGPQPQPPTGEGLPAVMLVDEVNIFKWSGPGGATGDFEIPYNATGLAPQTARVPHI